MTFGEKIQKVLFETGRIQADVVKRTGLLQSRVNNIINGKGTARVGEAFRIARALGVPLDYLADEGVDERPEATRTEQERQILEIAGRLGYDVALNRLINAPEPQPAVQPGPQSPAGPRVGSGTVVRPPAGLPAREKGFG